jgi:hypothetical protein
MHVGGFVIWDIGIYPSMVKDRKSDMFNAKPPSPRYHARWTAVIRGYYIHNTAYIRGYGALNT